jgi:hypothetical protein
MSILLCAGRARDEKTKSMTVRLKENKKIVDTLVPKLRKFARMFFGVLIFILVEGFKYRLGVK